MSIRTCSLTTLSVTLLITLHVEGDYQDGKKPLLSKFCSKICSVFEDNATANTTIPRTVVFSVAF